MAEGWQLFLDSFWPIVLGGLTGTIPLAVASFAIGLVIALGVALMRLSKNRVVSGIARFYVSVIRGTPLLVQLFVIFYGMPSIGIVLEPWPSAIIAFSLNVGGYGAEVIRAAILSVPKGQWEAGYTIGMSNGTDAAAHHPAAGRARLGAAAVEHVHLAREGHVARVAHPRHRAVPGRRRRSPRSAASSC